MNTKVDIIVGARPNFMKAAPVLKALEESGAFDVRLVHTGQHYDISMSDVFFTDLQMRAPDIHLEVGKGTQTEQLGKIMLAYEQACLENKPDWVIVVGDVTSTLAASLAANKTGIKVAHLEAGLRSYDREMPEEINRVLTDQISDKLWTPSIDADENLQGEGIAAERIECVGNIMIDALEMLRGSAMGMKVHERLGVEEGEFGLVTLHRPNNVDNPEKLARIIGALSTMAEKCKLVFPVHPRTQKALEAAGLEQKIKDIPGLVLSGPLGYLEFMGLQLRAKFILTDSGGIQEETTYLQIPCMTLRPNTERPITVTMGTNRIVSLDSIPVHFEQLMAGQWQEGEVPPLWDGKTAVRVVQSLARECGINLETLKRKSA